MVDTAHETPAAPAAAARQHRLELLLDGIKDPEIPVISIAELGILRDFSLSGPDGKGARIIITPTYSGCPAMEQISADIRQVLEAAGYDPVRIETRLAPAWTTDWLSASGRRKLLEFGIAPPLPLCGKADPNASDAQPTCPHCGAQESFCISPFSSTACKALFRCQACQEPFEYFKCI